MVKRLVLALMLLVALCGCSKEHLHTEFLTPVCIKPYKEYQYHTCNDINFIVDGQSFHIPAGFQTDLASIPKVAWPIIAPSHSSLIRPAIVHDWFYRKTCDFTRLQTDLIFFHMLKNDGISHFKASTMYYVVRLFGWRFFNKDYCE